MAKKDTLRASVCLLGLLHENQNEYMLAEWAFLQAKRQLRVREEKEQAEKKKEEEEKKEKERKEKEEAEEEKDAAEQGETRLWLARCLIIQNAA